MSRRCRPFRAGRRARARRHKSRRRFERWNPGLRAAFEHAYAVFQGMTDGWSTADGEGYPWLDTAQYQVDGQAWGQFSENCFT